MKTAVFWRFFFSIFDFRYQRKHVNLRLKSSANMSQNWFRISNQSKSVQMCLKKFVQNPNLHREKSRNRSLKSGVILRNLQLQNLIKVCFCFKMWKAIKCHHSLQKLYQNHKEKLPSIWQIFELFSNFYLRFLFIHFLNFNQGFSSIVWNGDVSPNDGYDSTSCIQETATMYSNPIFHFGEKLDHNSTSA